MEIITQVFFFCSPEKKLLFFFFVHLHSTTNSGSILILQFYALSQVKWEEVNGILKQVLVRGEASSCLWAEYFLPT